MSLFRRLPLGVLLLNHTFLAALAVLLMVLCCSPGLATPPAYDHVVIVIEENEDIGDIIGNPSAPYINSLAGGGVSFTRMRSFTHPSSPNYIEFFSGDGQGVFNDSTPSNFPFSTPNLGAALLAAGKTFTGYAESLPNAGDIISDGINSYVRRHCPWVWWMVSTPPMGNQLPALLHKPFTAFPTDFTQLPTVAFVIPNNLHNMHDTTIKDGDNWLGANLGAYATWARTHNSLLILTWDENDFTQPNTIPTIFYGANLANGQNIGSWTPHNILRTLEDMYGLTHSGRAALVPPIVGAFSWEPPLIARSFRRGTAGYNDVHDTQLSSASPNATYGSTTALGVRKNAFQSLVRFDNLFGTGLTQIPPGVNIVSAKLILTSANSTVSTTPLNLHQMLIPWTESSTWSDTGTGISIDGVESIATPDFSVVAAYDSPTACIFDVTGALQGWQGGSPNYGWTLQGTDTTRLWQWYSAEGSANFRPALEVTYTAADSIGFTTNAVAVAESAGLGTLTVSRPGNGSGAASVDYATSDITAVSGSDYVPTSGTLTWADGDTSNRSIVVPIVNDPAVEGNKAFLVSLANFTGTAVPGNYLTVTVTITEPPINTWRVAQFGAAGANSPDAADLADPDSDSVCNLLEYSFGSKPLTPTKLPRAGIKTSDGNSYLTLAFLHSGAPDLIYTVQVSSDLATWADGSTFSASGDTPDTAVTQLVSRGLTSSGEEIGVRDLIPFSFLQPRFMRLRVTRISNP